MTAPRVLFGFCLLLSWINSSSHVLSGDTLPYNASIFGFNPFEKRLVPLLVLGACFLTVLVAWVMDVQALLAGWAILALMLGIRQWERVQWHDDIVVSLGKYVPAAASLLGYQVAYTLTGNPQFGWEAACGVLAGAYFINGVTKVQMSGLNWLGSHGLGLLIAERSYVGWGPLRVIRRWSVSNPRVIAVLSGGAIGLELLAFIYVFDWARWPVTVAVTTLLCGIAVLLGYWEIEWILVMIALTLLSVGPPL